MEFVLRYDVHTISAGFAIDLVMCGGVHVINLYI